MNQEESTMLMQEERELVVEYGKKMSADRLSTGTSGNISIYNAEKGLMAISPSGMDYFSTTPADIVITDLNANIVDGNRKPSSEWALHTTFYKHKPHARAVVHTHSMFCTTFAVLGQPVRAVHYVIGDAGTATVPCAPYCTFGTEELAEAAMKVCGESDAVLLGNHGLVVCGKDIKSAYGLARNMEYIAELQYRAMCIGQPNILTDEQMAEVMEKFKSYGQPGAKKTGY
jgi:L-fuculose-phosphate aldolase